MYEAEYLQEISKHLYKMGQHSSHSKQYRASKLLTQSYIILYNALPGPHKKLTLNQGNNVFVVRDKH